MVGDDGSGRFLRLSSTGTSGAAAAKQGEGLQNSAYVSARPDGAEFIPESADSRVVDLVVGCVIIDVDSSARHSQENREDEEREDDEEHLVPTALMGDEEAGRGGVGIHSSAR